MLKWFFNIDWFSRFCLTVMFLATLAAAYYAASLLMEIYRENRAEKRRAAAKKDRELVWMQKEKVL